MTHPMLYKTGLVCFKKWPRWRCKIGWHHWHKAYRVEDDASIRGVLAKDCCQCHRRYYLYGRRY